MPKTILIIGRKLRLLHQAFALLGIRMLFAETVEEAAEVLRLSASDGVVLDMDGYERLYNRAHIDGLTGIFNRTYLLDRLRVELDRADRTSRPLCVAMVDVDHFKRVNDSYGHMVGDDVLIEVARTLKASTRNTDLAGRYGGEEFVVVLPDTALPAALVFAERLRMAIHNLLFSVSDDVLQVTASLGLAEYRPGESMDSLLYRADQALYRAKNQGRNQVVTDDRA